MPEITCEFAPAGTWDTAREVGQVLIDHDRRFRRRLLLQTEQGSELLLDLPQAVRLRGRMMACCCRTATWSGFARAPKP